uniref:Asialoglycoprotein receptor 1 n=1 Tax=Chrysemys picta bellii TaxID=8478 RepID=A0A8C3FNF0_CHRPI
SPAGWEHWLLGFRGGGRLSPPLTSPGPPGSRAGCCPRGWLRFGDSCYWFSGKQKTWEESNLYCKAQNSHLVVINTQDEQLYIQQQTVPWYTWIGLSNRSGRWQWVDGSVYTMDWRAGQPDESDGHGLGGGEDCVYLHDDGLWNNAQCSRRYRWVCEEELKEHEMQPPLGQGGW